MTQKTRKQKKWLKLFQKSVKWLTAWRYRKAAQLLSNGFSVHLDPSTRWRPVLLFKCDIKDFLCQYVTLKNQPEIIIRSGKKSKSQLPFLFYDTSKLITDNMKKFIFQQYASVTIQWRRRLYWTNNSSNCSILTILWLRLWKLLTNNKKCSRVRNWTWMQKWLKEVRRLLK